MNLIIEKSEGRINCFNKYINTIEFTGIDFKNCNSGDFTSLLFLYKENDTFFFEKAHFYFNPRHNRIEFSPTKIRINQNINKLIIKFEELKSITDYSIYLGYEIS